MTTIFYEGEKVVPQSGMIYQIVNKATSNFVELQDGLTYFYDYYDYV